MSRQHTSPILIGPDGSSSLAPLSLGTGPDQISEAQLQHLIQAHPACLPIREIDPLFSDPVPMCMELSTSAGPIDNLLITASGLPVIVECKLWRNPQGRREVVGQILDYAKELTRWSAADMQREVARRTGISPDPILTLLSCAGHAVDEVAFNDALTHNLRRGRFLLLIVGDGIREGVEAIAEYLQSHANLHFSLGLVEMPVFLMPDGRKLITPRVLARTHVIERNVINLPQGQAIAETVDEEEFLVQEVDDRDPLSPRNFWTEFLSGIALDDPEQTLPNPSRKGFVTMTMPVSGGVCWLTIYRNVSKQLAGIYLSYQRNTMGSRVVERLLQDWQAIRDELGGAVEIDVSGKDGRSLMEDRFTTGPLAIDAEREKALVWLRRRTNDFVNVLRPRIKAILVDLEREN